MNRTQVEAMWPAMRRHRVRFGRAVACSVCDRPKRQGWWSPAAATLVCDGCLPGPIGPAPSLEEPGPIGGRFMERRVTGSSTRLELWATSRVVVVAAESPWSGPPKLDVMRGDVVWVDSKLRRVDVASVMRAARQVQQALTHHQLNVPVRPVLIVPEDSAGQRLTRQIALESRSGLRTVLARDCRIDPAVWWVCASNLPPHHQSPRLDYLNPTLTSSAVAAVDLAALAASIGVVSVAATLLAAWAGH